MNKEEVSRIVREVVGKYTGIPQDSARHVIPAVPASTAKSCRAAVLTAPGSVEIRKFPIREISDDEILIRVEGCGVCGTDVHEFKGDPMKLAPLVLGHEGTGEIVRLGKNVKRDNGESACRLATRSSPA